MWGCAKWCNKRQGYGQTPFEQLPGKVHVVADGDLFTQLLGDIAQFSGAASPDKYREKTARMATMGDNLIYSRKIKENFDVLNFQLLLPPPVVGEDLSVPPMDGLQYLRRVIEEKKKCESVVTAELNLPAQSNIQTINVPTKKECSKTLLPSKNYQRFVLADFSRLRLKMESHRKKIEEDATFKTIKKSLPMKREDEKWLEICSQEGPDVVRECTKNGPSTRLCLAMSQMKICRVLSYFPDWVTEGALGVVDTCRWVYCLLACLDLPVEPDVYFTMRQIARALMELRAGLENVDSESLPHINLIICIIGRYFGQVDLADPYV